MPNMNKHRQQRPADLEQQRIGNPDREDRLRRRQQHHHDNGQKDEEDATDRHHQREGRSSLGLCRVGGASIFRSGSAALTGVVKTSALERVGCLCSVSHRGLFEVLRRRLFNVLLSIFSLLYRSCSWWAAT